MRRGGGREGREGKVEGRGTNHPHQHARPLHTLRRMPAHPVSQPHPPFHTSTARRLPHLQAQALAHTPLHACPPPLQPPPGPHPSTQERLGGCHTCRHGLLRRLMPCAMFSQSMNADTRWSMSPASPACGRNAIVLRPRLSRNCGRARKRVWMRLWVWGSVSGGGCRPCEAQLCGGRAPFKTAHTRVRHGRWRGRWSTGSGGWWLLWRVWEVEYWQRWVVAVMAGARGGVLAAVGGGCEGGCGIWSSGSGEWWL
eukprot:365385-Chlamydomonas_euryale.AAC.4